MKNWNQIFEHHDAEWPQELLSMTVDQLLDQLKEKGLDDEYETIENILKANMMMDQKEEMPTWDEMQSGETTDFDKMMNKDSWINGLDFE
jgi:hypothetical protein